MTNEDITLSSRKNSQNRMKRIIILSFFVVLSTLGHTQNSATVFSFLKLPHSAHATALGGENITTICNDLTLAFHNPALLSNVSDNTLHLGYTSYIEGSKIASAAYSRQFGSRSAWAAAVQFMNYGKITETDINNNELGAFAAKDIAFMGIYNYLLSERWSGGVTAKLIQGNYAEFTSFAIGIDLGINYFHDDNDFSASLTLKNLGGQIKTFDNIHEQLPTNLQVGFTKRLAHAPIKISATLDDLLHWYSTPYNQTDKDDNFGNILITHLIFGVEIAPSDRFYIAAGYNGKRSKELKVNNGSKWTGATLGAGINLKRIKLGVAYANYHTAASSLIMNIGIGF